MSHEQMLLNKYHSMVDKANSEAWKVEELEKKTKELLTSKNVLHKEVEELTCLAQCLVDKLIEEEKIKKKNEKLEKENEELEKSVYISQLLDESLESTDTSLIHESVADIARRLEEENKKLQECLLGYWSDGMLGNTEAWTPPETWQTMLDEANDAN